jgi:phage terminase Nu1 subunit (DNA packaging protein)
MEAPQQKHPNAFLSTDRAILWPALENLGFPLVSALVKESAFPFNRAFVQQWLAEKDSERERALLESREADRLIAERGVLADEKAALAAERSALAAEVSATAATRSATWSVIATIVSVLSLTISVAAALYLK